MCFRDSEKSNSSAFKASTAQLDLIEASKCADFVLDHGHYFGEVLDPDLAKNDETRAALIAFLKML
jgi:hypothetical protein